MAKRVIHRKSAAQVEGAPIVRTLCGEGTKSAEYASDDPAAVTCATCRKRGGVAPEAPMTVADVERAEAIVAAKGAALDERSVYVSLTQSSVGIRRRVAVSQEMVKAMRAQGIAVVDAEANGEADASNDGDRLLHVGKDIFDSAELREIRQAQNATYLWIYYNGYRSNVRPGFHRLPLALVERFVQFVEKQDVAVAVAVEKLILRYNAIKAAARARLEPLGLYDEADYPHPQALRGAFHTEYSFTSIGPAQQLSTVSRDLYHREEEKARAKAEEELKSIVAALRLQFAELVEHMVAILEPGPDGRAKRFREASLDNAREFFGLFDARNLGGDETLKPLVERASKLLEGVDAKQLKESGELRDKIRAEFAAVKGAMVALVALKPQRAVKLGK